MSVWTTSNGRLPQVSKPEHTCMRSRGCVIGVVSIYIQQFFRLQLVVTKKRRESVHARIKFGMEIMCMRKFSCFFVTINQPENVLAFVTTNLKTGLRTKGQESGWLSQKRFAHVYILVGILNGKYVHVLILVMFFFV